MPEGLPTAIARRLNPVILCADAVVHIGPQDPVLHEHRALPIGAFVIDIDRTARIRLGAIINDRHIFGRDVSLRSPQKLSIQST